MNDILFNAILAMDSYNRGYGAGIDFNVYDDDGNIISVPTQIGNATIISDSEDLGVNVLGIRNDQFIGFYAVEYKLNGETIISYRGTDGGLDPLTGYQGAIGGIGPQQEMAFEFYNEVAKAQNSGVAIDPRQADIFLTGHSLGGGLAGLVGSVYHQEALLYDNMAFELSANTLSSSTLFLPLHQNIYGSWQLDQNGNPTTWAHQIVPNDPNGPIVTHSLDGEFLGYLSRAIQQSYEEEHVLPGNPNIVRLTPDALALHSQASLVIQLYADTKIPLETAWHNASPHFWPVLYDDGFAKSIGAGTVDNQVRKDGDYHGLLRTAIAYSAIEGGTGLVFGDTGVKALYDDAGDFGWALTSADSSNAIVTYATDISKVFVQFAGTLALNKIVDASVAEAKDGVLTFNADIATSTGSFDVSLSDDLWKKAGSSAKDIVVRDDLLNGILADSGDEAFLRSLTNLVWSDDGNDVYGRVVFALEGFATARIEDVGLLPNEATLFVGIDGNDSVIGSGGNDLILGGQGNDVILTSGSGTDIVHGGADNDTFFADFGSDVFEGGSEIDTIDYTVQDAYEIANSGTGNGIRIEANLTDGTVERSLINGGGESVDFINNVEQVIGASGDDLYKGKEGLVGQGFTGNGQTTERGDKIDFSDYSAAVSITLGGTGADSAGGTFTTLVGIEQVVGTTFLDTLTGDNSDNWLFGNNGVDTLRGNGGDDHLIGGVGSDFLEGGGANDTYYFSLNAQQTLWHHTGFDIIDDSSGTDDIAYLLGGYIFNPDDHTKSGGQFHINGVARTETLTDLEWVEYSDGAKFGVDRLILDEADATTFAPVGTTLSGDMASNTLTASPNTLLVNGNEGDDWLHGIASNDLTLAGGAGSDYLFGFSGNTLDGGGGNDYLDGGFDSNVKYRASSGVDVIKDFGGNGNLEVAASFTLWKADNGSLVVDHSGATTADEVIASTDKVIVLNHFSGLGIETINGNAVSTITISHLGTSIDDFLQGDGANDVFAASKGDDVQNGGTGANTFSFAANDTGSTIVRTTPDAQTDLLIFNGLSQSEVSVIRDASIGTNNLLFSYGQSFAVVEDAILDTANANHLNVQFANTSTLTFASLNLTTRGSNQADTLDGDAPGFSVDDIIFGGAGNDIIDGGIGEDVIDGGVGDDTIETGIGSDTVTDSAGDDLYTLGKGDHIFLNGSGSDRIEFDGTDASAGDLSETFVVHLPSFISSGDIIVTRDSSDSAFINVTYGGNDVDIQSAFTPILEFDGGLQFSINDFALTTNGTDSDDNITDYIYLDQNRSQDDIINAGDGNDDVVVTNGGIDIVFGGGGNDTISQTELLGFPTTGTVTFHGEDGNDVLSTQTLSGSLFGGAGDDILISGDTTDMLDGGDGDDWISAGNGDDDILGGAGRDIILGLLGGAKTIDGGEGNDLIVLDGDADDTVDGGAGLDTVSFEGALGLTIAQIDLSSQSANIDGVLYAFSNIEGVIGSSGNDTIIGNSSNNILDGGAGFNAFLAGDDNLQGGAGSDTYVFGTPFEVRVPPNQTPGIPQPPVVGDDIVNDSSGSSDSIEFTDFFTLSDLSFNQVGSNLVISFTEGSVTIIDQSGAGEIENLILGDGTILNLSDYDNWTLGTQNADTLTGIVAGEALYGLDADDVINAYVGGSSLYGGFGVDTLNGGLGNDILNGGAGDDITSGGAGDDIYVFSPGDGIDVITETSGFDILSVKGAVTLSDLTFSQAGNDLQIDIASGVTITDFYAGDLNLLLEEIHFDDGSIFDLTSLINTAPIAVDDTFTGTQDSLVIGNVLADNGGGVDSDPDGDLLSVVEGTFTTANGVVSLESDGEFRYFVNSGYSGLDSFTYTLEDGRGGSDTATVTLDIAPTLTPIVNGVAEAENLVDPAGTLNGLSEITIVVQVDASLIGTDRGIFDTESPDQLDDTLTMRYDSSGFFGGGQNVIKVGLLTTAGQLQFESASNVQTTDLQHLVITWKSGEALKLYIDGVETVPTYDTGSLGGVITNVQDLLLGIGAKDAGGWAGTINDFQIYDVALDAAAVNTLATNASTNIFPDAINDLFVGDQDMDVTGNVLVDNGNGADNDPNGNPLNVIAGTFATNNGSVTIAANGDFTYTPDTGYAGRDIFTYTLEDGLGGSDTAIVSLEIFPIIDFTGASFISYNGGQDAGGTIGVIEAGAGVELNGNAWKKMAFDYVITQNTVINFEYKSTIQGEVQGFGLETDDNWQTGAENYQLYGTDSAFNRDFDYNGSGVWQSFSIDVGSFQTGQINWLTFVNDHDLGAADGTSFYRNISIYESGLLAIDDEFNGSKDMAVVGNVLVDNGSGVDSDFGGGALSVVAGTFVTTNGSVTLTSNGDFTYTPNAGFIGTDNFAYTLENGFGDSDNGNAHINVLLDIPTEAPIIDFTGVTFNSYNGGQDGGGTIAVIEAGAGVQLDGNAWKKMAFDYVVTQNTAINFEYKSTIEGEVFGFGLETDDNFQTGAENYQLYGTDSAFNRDFDYAGSGEWQSFSIDVGSFQTGAINWLTFVNDHDLGAADGTSFYRNISIYEGGTSSDDTLTGSANDETFVGFEGNDTLNGLGGNDVLFGNDGSDFLHGGTGDDVLYGGAGIDMLYGQGDSDTFMFEAVSAFTASDNIQDFKLSENDKLDVSDLLVGYDPLTDAITDFIQITEIGTDSYLNVDADGGADNFVQVAYIFNETGLTDEEALETSGNLIAA